MKEALAKHITNKILGSSLTAYLDIDDDNFFFKEIDNCIVIIRGKIFSNVEYVYIDKWLENNLKGKIKSFVVIDNKVKIYL